MARHRKPRVQRELLRLVWIVVLTCLLAGVVLDDFRVLKQNASIVELFIYGIITERDANALEALSPELEQRLFPWIKLDSIGGDVDAAMKIGRLVRQYEGFTSIEREDSLANANCYSSCALIFIAGVRRSIVSPGGQLGLHRPYLASMPRIDKR